MTVRTAMSLGAMCLLLLGNGRQQRDLPSATAQHGGFALPDPGGTRLLANPDVPQADTLHAALCSDGRRYAVRFEGPQTEREGHDGRRTAYSFDRLAGSRFAVLQGRIGGGKDPAGVACFLAGDALLSSATLLAARPASGPDECGPDLQRRLSTARGRGVAHCWPIATLPAGRSLVLAEFVRQGPDALASMIMVGPDRAIFADYPATFRGEGEELWRAGDGGVLSPGDFRAVFVLQRGPSYVMGVSWAASEGQSLAVFVSTDDNRFTQVLSDYWYWAPL
jgi:hypothetical protein